MNIQNIIYSKLSAAFAPTHLEVINESHMHRVPAGAESHFRVVVVSDQFNDLPAIERHRQVHQALELELKTGVHARAMVAKTP
jgi:BolA protein